MNEIRNLPYIESTLALLLEEIGIHSKDDLVAMTSPVAFKKIRSIWKGAGINMLYAIESVVLGVHLHALPEDKRAELLAAWNEISQEDTVRGNDS